MNRYEIYIAGKFVKTPNVLKVCCPYDGELIAETFLAGKNELETAITGALAVRDEMKNMPSYRRYDALMQIAGQIKAGRERLAKVLALEAAKPLKLALVEIDRAVQTFIVAAEEAKRLPAEYISTDWTPAGEGKEGLVKYFPIGLIAGIAPFNFPLMLAVHKIAPALASGNPIILKPARATPLSVLELAKIIDGTSLPKGAVSIVPMDREAGNQLVTDERFKMLTFTGSPEVGWQMKRDAGMKKVTLELGGNAGAIVSPTANLELAMKKCVAGSFAYAGQVCIHTQRIYVHDSVYDKFIAGFLERTCALKHGHPESMETEISSLIDLENAIRVENRIKEAVEGGAKILAGGKRNDTFVEPTVLTGTDKNMKVCCSEIFGPVVVIEKYSSYKEAVNWINGSIYGLQAGVFTDSIDEMNYAFKEIEVGGLMINEVPTYRVDHAPYGGIKNSGFGREGLKYAIFEMMEPRVMIKNC